MPAFVFLGGPECGVDSVCMFGVWFPLGAVVEVTDHAIARKLAGNKFFAKAGIPSGDPTPEPYAEGEWTRTVSDDGKRVDFTFNPAESKQVKRRGRPPRV